MLRKENLHSAHLSCPDWSQEKIDCSYGVVRDYVRAKDLIKKLPLNLGFDGITVAVDNAGRKLLEPVRAYDVKSRREYPAHANIVDDNVPCIVIGHGNLLTNLGVVGYTSDGRILKPRGEELRITRGWQYGGLYLNQENRLGIDRFCFCDDAMLKKGIKWFASGLVVLWDGVVKRGEDVLSHTYDFRSIYRLRMTSGNSEEKERATVAFHNMMAVWMDAFTTSAEDANTVLSGVVSKLQLERENAYLASAVGIDDSDNLILLQCHGSIEDIGISLRRAGALRGIVLDFGGSVGTYCRSRARSGFVMRSQDFREDRLCALVFALQRDLWDEA
ncbi:hypothetical protein HY486_02120 [Candidatus Woesearchaeota archaeon]|nr:hypothetical protein [Candidatus Woesearchaeota archaeon]